MCALGASGVHTRLQLLASNGQEIQGTHLPRQRLLGESCPRAPIALPVPLGAARGRALNPSLAGF